MPCRQLSLYERRATFRLLDARAPVATNEAWLGHRSTVYGEIRRNFFHKQREYAGYLPHARMRA
jgi:IS30 family transposase